MGSEPLSFEILCKGEPVPYRAFTKREQEALDEHKKRAQEIIDLGLLPEGVSLNLKEQLHVWLLEAPADSDNLTLQGQVPDGIEEVWVRWTMPDEGDHHLRPSGFHLKIWPGPNQ